MGVKGLLKKLPGSKMEDQRVGFSTLDILCRPARRLADSDTITLVFIYVLRHKEAYNAGRYFSSLRQV